VVNRDVVNPGEGFASVNRQLSSAVQSGHHRAMLLDYSTLKALHAGSALVSVTLFIIRGGWMIAKPERLRQRWVKVVPHVVDTVLLVSALAMVWGLGGLEALRTQSWLGAKLVALFAYIALGSVALKRGRTRRIRVAAFCAAIAVFGYIVSVAITKSPSGFVDWL
jgi:uncharacterized membrane protein SirB2